MAIPTGIPEANPDLPDLDVDPVAQAISIMEERSAQGQRRYVAGELTRLYRELGSQEKFGDLQQAAANGWHEDNPAYVQPSAGAPIYPTARERAQSNPGVQKMEENSTALYANIVLHKILEASKLAIACYISNDRAARSAARDAGSQMYDHLHPKKTSPVAQGVDRRTDSHQANASQISDVHKLIDKIYL